MENNELELNEIEEEELDELEPTEESGVASIAKLVALGIGAGVTTFAVIKRNAVKQWFRDKRDTRLAKKGYVRVEVIDPENETDSSVDEENPEK